MCKKLIYLISFAVILGLCADTAIADLVAYYPLDEGSGNTTVDASGNEHDGTIVGEPAWVDGPSGLGTALYYNGVSPATGWVNCGTWNPSENTGQLSVAFWAQWDGATGGWQGVVGKRDGWDETGKGALSMWEIEVNADSGVISFFRGGSDPGSGDVVLPVGEWTHITVTFDGTTQIFYVNGEETGRGDFTFGPKTDATIEIGCDNNDGWNSFNGTIDEVKIWDHALSQAEIKGAMAGEVWPYNPVPADGSLHEDTWVNLSWSPGDTAASHDVYLGDNFDDVSAGAGSTFRGNQTATFFAAGFPGFPYPNGLVPSTTYYWRIDEVEADGTTVHRGNVWSFTPANILVIDDFESYTDDIEAGLAIFQTWIDDIGGAENGATVGYPQPPYADQTTVFSGEQSMPLFYDNTFGVVYSEVERTFTELQDWTVKDIDALILFVHGRPPKYAETDEGGVVLSGAGADIWGTSDEFRFAYKRLSGDGLIVARVVDNGQGSNTWAKGGVMIRETLQPGSKHAMMIITDSDGGGMAFQCRPETGGSSLSSHGNPTASPPYWVKITREGSTFTGYSSADGVTWVQQPDGTGGDMTPVPVEIEMDAEVYIGLCVTSHASGDLRTYEFDNTYTTGAVFGQWQVADVGVAQPGNDREPLYVGLEDNAGNVAVSVNPDPDVLLIDEWTDWQIPLSEFADAGVNLREVKKMSIGAGQWTESEPPDLPEPGPPEPGPPEPSPPEPGPPEPDPNDPDYPDPDEPVPPRPDPNDPDPNFDMLMGPKLFASSDGSGMFNIGLIITAGPGFGVLMGTVRSSDPINGTPVSGAWVTVDGFRNLQSTGSDGFYAVCLITGRTYNAEVTAPGFPRKTVSSVYSRTGPWLQTFNFAMSP